MSDSPSRQRLAIGPLRIDLRQSTVENQDGTQALTPRAESLLLLLCRNAGRLVTREQIHENVWAGRVVEDAAITNIVWQIRRALGEQGKDMLQTRAKRGYVLMVPDSAWRVEDDVPEAVPNETSENIERSHAEGDRSARPAPGVLFDGSTQPTTFAPRATAKRPRLVFAFAGLVLAGVAAYGVHLWRAPTDAPARTAKIMLTPDAELSVSVQVPEKLDWVRNAVLRVAMEQAYLRDATVVHFHGRQQHNPFVGPHLQVDLREVDAEAVAADIVLSQGRATSVRKFNGPAHDLSRATADLLIAALPPTQRALPPGAEAYLSGRVADARFDSLGALAEYRRAIAQNSDLVDAKIAMANRFDRLGRAQDALAMLNQIDAEKNMTDRQRCARDMLVVYAAPERLGDRPCEMAAHIMKLEKLNSRDALREAGMLRKRPLGARNWLNNEINAAIAHIDLGEYPQAESTIARGQKIATAAGWTHGEILLRTWRAESAWNRGRVEEAIRLRMKDASELEALGDIETALVLRIDAIKWPSPVPGDAAARDREELRKIIGRAREAGIVQSEIEALKKLLELNRDNLDVWQSQLNLVKQLIDRNYSLEYRIHQEHYLLGELLPQARYRDVLDGVRRLEKTEPIYPIKTWSLPLKALAHFSRDEIGLAVAAIDAMEREGFDFTATTPSPCAFAWMLAEAGKLERARMMLRECPYAEYDGTRLAQGGYYGLYADARIRQFSDQPERAWPLLKPYIDGLLAVPALSRHEAESLTFLARHATSMPGSDFDRLHAALKRTTQIAGRDGAGPTLRLGVHLLKWRLCAAQARDDCGPLLPAWANEERLEARLATEYRDAIVAASRPKAAARH
jgi:DNA-binding winged helix-turn-helix (wHTH) protein/tetratricopeptide (TPR) repeat protein